MNKTTLKYKAFKTALTIAALLPLGVLHLISSFAAFLLHKVFKYRVGVVRKNLRIAFPEKSDAELRAIENRFYLHLCDIFIETAKLAHISDEQIARRVTVEGIDAVNDPLKEGKSVVVMLGHYGNWEWVTAAARLFYPGTVACEIYHPLRNKAFDRLMLDLRSRFGTENIPMAKTVRRLLEIHRDDKNFACGFIADQRPFTPTLKHWTDFLGIDTAYVNGGEVIGEKLGAAFVYGEMLPVSRGHYKLTFTPITPLEDGEENPYTRAYLRKLEESIRRNPPYWLWSHNRWKRTRQ